MDLQPAGDVAVNVVAQRGQGTAALQHRQQHADLVGAEADAGALGVGETAFARQRLDFGHQRTRAFHDHGHDDARHGAVGTVPIEIAGIGHFRQAVAAHLENAHLVGAAVTVLAGPQRAVHRRIVVGEHDHRVHHVLQQHGAGDAPFLGDVSDEHHGYAVFLGIVDADLRRGAHLRGRARPAFGLRSAHGLHAVHDDQAVILRQRQGVVDDRVTADVEPVVKDPQPFGAQPQLRRRLFAGDIEHAPPRRRNVTADLQQQRRFADAGLAAQQHDAAYLASAMRYERALKQRNALLRESSEPDEAIMDVLEDMMSADAQVICDARRAYAEGFAPIFRELYSQISGRDAELAQVEYSIQTQPSDLREKLRTMRERERIVGHTLYGPHRDDLLLTLGGYAIKREGSQGQIKTFFVSMKLSQFLFLKRTIAGSIPILLLDDIFDKLDAGRVERIIRLVTQSEFGQIFITDTNRGHLDTILAASAQGYRLFNVADGILNGCE